MRFIFLLVFIAYSISCNGQDTKRAEKAEKKHKPLLSNAMRKAGFTPGKPVFIRIFKQEKTLEIWVKKDTAYSLFETYDICYFSGGLGPKTKQGDSKSPEGFYETSAGALNAFSSYHLSFNTGYPNAYDRARGYTGSALMVHGDCVSIGCYAMGDDNIEEIWTMLKMAFEGGQRSVPIHIFPFKMTDAGIKQFHANANIEFWKNLKEGYDYFESKKRPPTVILAAKKYKFR